MKSYEEGPRDLQPTGEMRICKYDDTIGLNTTIETMENPCEIKYKPKTRWWHWLNVLPSILYEMDEVEWTKKAISRAKELGADSVYYYDEWSDSYRETLIWKRR